MQAEARICEPGDQAVQFRIESDNKKDSIVVWVKPHPRPLHDCSRQASFPCGCQAAFDVIQYNPHEIGPIPDGFVPAVCIHSGEFIE